MKSLPTPDNIEDAVLCTHQGCMDGAGCAIMFLKAGGKRENIHYVAAGMLEAFFKKQLEKLSDKFIILADIGLTSGEGRKYAEMLQKRSRCVLLDHHATSEHLRNYSWCLIDQKKCGTQLLREYLRVQDADSILLSTYIADHDLWTRTLSASVELASLSVYIGQDEFVTRFKDREISTFGLFTVSELDMLDVLSKRRDSIHDSAIKRVIIRQMNWGSDTAKVAYTFCQDMNSSLLLDRIIQEHPEIDVACQINLDKATASLRSRNGFDVSKMATYFGGGGHKAASGHRVSRKLIEDLVYEIHGA